jgi:micrococcal nuclease
MRLTNRLCAGLFWLAALFPAAAAPSSCDVSAARDRAQLDRVGERLDIVLIGGRRLYFPSVEPPRATSAAPDRPMEVASELTSLLRGHRLFVLPLGAEDRWSRIPARLFVEGATESADETLAAAGLVMASADPGPCGAAVKAAEADARAAGLGVWADPAFAILSGDDPAPFIARAGVLTIVEGRIRSIGHAFGRTYLNFAARRGGAALVIARRNLPAFERAGLGEKSLLDHQVRARGVVEIGAAPQIELFHPGQIEFIQEAPQADGARHVDSSQRR